MTYIEVALLLLGVIALAVGYRKNHRNLLLSAAVILFLAGAVGDLASGFHDGFSASWSSAAVTR